MPMDIDRVLDTIIDNCDRILVGSSSLKWHSAERAARKIARHLGSFSELLKDLPYISTFMLSANGCSIRYVGTKMGATLMGRVLFPGKTVVPKFTYRFALPRLADLAYRWLSSEAEMVICEVSRFMPTRLYASISFSVPDWIDQVIDLPEKPEDLIAGRRMKRIRHRVRRAERWGFTYRFSTSISDFNYFYYSMYLPYIITRHGELAIICPYRDMLKTWFNKGGLVLVTQDDRPVAGALCYLDNRACYSIVGGVLDGDSHLVKQGINTIIDWAVINWGHRQGVRFVNMGGSRPWSSDGTFYFKRGWGARVTECESTYRQWIFLANYIPERLRRILNRVGFIVMLRGKPYLLVLSQQTSCEERWALRTDATSAHRHGLSGIAYLAPNSHFEIIKK